jgi:Periplasmic copper-binding protein (NosD)
LTLFTDTVHFDTVFTTTGSVTKFFKIFNTNEQGLHIGSVALKGGDSSPFMINVNGTIGPVVNGLSIAARDSAYVFVTVKVDPSTASMPFVVRDSIEISYNGNREFVQLEAYGQNARFLRNRVITGDEVWQAGLPYVLLGGLEVAQGGRLTIEKDCKIYAHADAAILVKGTLDVQGRDMARVVFASDRLDEPYKDFPAGWPGIIFTKESKDNRIENAVIRNAYQGIVVAEPSSNSNPKLFLNETIIDNAYEAGLLASNTSIIARNLLISNCGNNLQLAGGGQYEFTHCTVASFYNGFISHKYPVLQVQNYFMQNGLTFSGNLNAVFRNCIFWGEGGPVEDEVVVNKEGNTTFSVLFDHVLWKVQKTPENATIQAAINNQSPEFETIDAEKNIFDFRLKESSPALNKGTASNVLKDLDGKPRPVEVADLGCYERQ